MKKITKVLMVFVMVFTLAACDNSTSNSQKNSTSNLEEKYPGYYANFDEGIISITNYNPDDMSNIPSYQEMIDYGDGAGWENEGTVYCIYIFDFTNSTEETEKSYYAELADETLEVLIEQDSYFASEEERKAVVDKLIEIINYVRNNSNE